eukprot:TRINITY_DN67458_c7_g7_i1.p1 TRINITY_DN67458_c7_g7~~TRINITY_DN67458_c7_g7_i1.p1  ORF type:complete len:292 (+),score=21.60 TRINITY_DN67458_c7_g7_i1:88-876(+)
METDERGCFPLEAPRPHLFRDVLAWLRQDKVLEWMRETDDWDWWDNMEHEAAYYGLTSLQVAVNLTKKHEMQQRLTKPWKWTVPYIKGKAAISDSQSSFLVMESPTQATSGGGALSTTLPLRKTQFLVEWMPFENAPIEIGVCCQHNITCDESGVAQHWGGPRCCGCSAALMRHQCQDAHLLPTIGSHENNPRAATKQVTSHKKYLLGMTVSVRKNEGWLELVEHQKLIGTKRFVLGDTQTKLFPCVILGGAGTAKMRGSNL